MNNTNAESKGKIIQLILNIMIVIATFFLLIHAGVLIQTVVEETTPMHGENSFYYAIEEENYAGMVGNYYLNTMEGHEGNATMQEYYGVAKYYEAASLYKAYAEVGNEEMATQFLEKMQDVEDEMGGWSVAKDAIHEQLGLE